MQGSDSVHLDGDEAGRTSVEAGGRAPKCPACDGKGLDPACREETCMVCGGSGNDPASAPLAEGSGDPVWCGCGDGIVADDGAKCGTCVFIDSLSAEDVARDAARYRWLRSLDHGGCSIYEMNERGEPKECRILIGGHADAFIDAAMIDASEGAATAKRLAAAFGSSVVASPEYVAAQQEMNRRFRNLLAYGESHPEARAEPPASGADTPA